MTKRKSAQVRDDGTAEFVCPHCRRSHIFGLEHGMRSSTPVRTRLRCDCGASHVVYLERRAGVRKSVQIRGQYSIQGDGAERAMMVENLSRTGLLFRVEEGSTLPVGARIEVTFSLDNPRVARFCKDAVVRRVAAEAVGAEFAAGANGSSYDRVYDLALALYDPAASEPQGTAAQ
jgi:hypothetical protein